MNSQIEVQALEHDGRDHRGTESMKPQESSAHYGQFSPGNRTRSLQCKFSKRPAVSRTLKWLILSVFLGFFIWVFLYSWMVVPLEKKLAAREAHGLAERIDSAVKLRAAVITAAAADLNLAGLNAPGALEAVRGTLLQAFPDFHSLEILNEEGDLLAMVGDISLSDSAGRSAPEPSDRREEKNEPLRLAFHDDPKGRCFFIVGTHQTSGGTPWFTRARFSRDTIERLLASSKSPLHATLVMAPVTDGALIGVDRDHANMSTDWRGNPASIEAPLSVPGWWIRMESVPHVSEASWLSLKTVALIFLALTVAIFILWRNAGLKQGPFDETPSIRPAAFDGDLHGSDVNEAVNAQEGGALSSGTVAASYDAADYDDHDDFFPNVTANDLLDSRASASKETEVGSATDREFPQELESVWSRPFAVEPVIHCGVVGPEVGECAPTAASEVPGTIPDCLEVQWIEPAEDETPTRSNPRRMGLPPTA